MCPNYCSVLYFQKGGETVTTGTWGSSVRNKIKAKIPWTSWGGDKNITEIPRRQDFRWVPGGQHSGACQGCVQLSGLSRGKAEGCRWASLFSCLHQLWEATPPTIRTPPPPDTGGHGIIFWACFLVKSTEANVIDRWREGLIDG